MPGKTPNTIRWLDDILDRVEAEGAQPLELSGRRRMIILPEEQFRLLKERKPTFKEFLLSMPSLEGIDLTRDRTPARDVDI